MTKTKTGTKTEKETRRRKQGTEERIKVETNTKRRKNENEKNVGGGERVPEGTVATTTDKPILMTTFPIMMITNTSIIDSLGTTSISTMADEPDPLTAIIDDEGRPLIALMTLEDDPLQQGDHHPGTVTDDPITITIITIETDTETIGT